MEKDITNLKLHLAHIEEQLIYLRNANKENSRVLYIVLTLNVSMIIGLISFVVK